jgi:hypothetical protein
MNNKLKRTGLCFHLQPARFGLFLEQHAFVDNAEPLC